MNDPKLTARADLDNEHVYIEIAGAGEAVGLWVSKGHTAALAEYLTAFCETVGGLVREVSDEH
jgi:hypothetical protein